MCGLDVSASLLNFVGYIIGCIGLFTLTSISWRWWVMVECLVSVIVSFLSSHHRLLIIPQEPSFHVETLNFQACTQSEYLQLTVRVYGLVCCCCNFRFHHFSVMVYVLVCCSCKIRHLHKFFDHDIEVYRFFMKVLLQLHFQNMGWIERVEQKIQMHQRWDRFMLTCRVLSIFWHQQKLEHREEHKFTHHGIKIYRFFMKVLL